MKYFFLLVLLIGFVCAVDVELNCPDDIYAGEGFECDVGVNDGDGIYDLKIDIDGERNSVLRVWDKEWKSGYYYIKDFIRDNGVVKLMIEKEGRYDVILKLRRGSEREEFDVGKIKVLKYKEPKENLKVDDFFVEDTHIKNLSSVNSDVIFLGENYTEGEKEWDYVSKDGKIIDLLPYGFCLFLIFLLAVLMWSQMV